ncbi:MAG: class I SAM-dependent methyltransferase [Nitrospirae bacterium]|nr:MAG: class I SAM-dependent methyltransferase [Nitrospirota bacterium]
MTPTVACRACGGAQLVPVVSLGTMALANALVPQDLPKSDEPAFPLELVFCPDCTLVQLTVSVSPELLFRDYVYFSSYSDTVVRSAREIARRVMQRQALAGGSLAVEVASNDGYLLQHYKEAGVPVLGIEPAQNIAKVAEERGIPTLRDFFGRDLAATLAKRGQSADVLHANNVLAHVPDLNGFVAGISLVLKEKGLAVIEVPYVKDMIDGCAFDTIYHEHLCYFSLTALDRLMDRYGLVIEEVESIPAQGGSLRLFVRRKAGYGQGPSVIGLLADEATWGVGDLQFYRNFASKMEAVRQTLPALLKTLKGQGRIVAGYGAAAKGAVLLNYCRIGPEVLDYVVDRNPHKQGLAMPGVRIPVVSPDRLVEQPPDDLLILPWNIAEEVMAQQAAYRDRGGRFVIPIPVPRVV